MALPRERGTRRRAILSKVLNYKDFVAISPLVRGTARRHPR
jgi:hypothetical protein